MCIPVFVNCMTSISGNSFQVANRDTDFLSFFLTICIQFYLISLPVQLAIFPADIFMLFRLVVDLSPRMWLVYRCVPRSLWVLDIVDLWIRLKTGIFQYSSIVLKGGETRSTQRRIQLSYFCCTCSMRKRLWKPVGTVKQEFISRDVYEYTVYIYCVFCEYAYYNNVL